MDDGNSGDSSRKPTDGVGVGNRMEGDQARQLEFVPPDIFRTLTTDYSTYNCLASLSMTIKQHKFRHSPRPRRSSHSIRPGIQGLRRRWKLEE